MTAKADPLASIGRFVHYAVGGLAREGGVTRAMFGWAKLQANSGYPTVILHDADEPQDAPTGVETRDIPHRGPRGHARLPVRFGDLLRPDDILTLHEPFKVPHLVAGEIAARRGVRYICMPHGGLAPRSRDHLRDPGGLRAMAERRQLRRAVGAHVFFEEEADNVRALEPAARTIVVPTGFEIAADGWVGGKYLAWLGRYSLRGKGLDILLEAVASFAPEERPPVILRGIDYLDGRREVAAEVERLGLNDVVQVLGPVYGDEKVEFLRHSRAFVHPSRYDAHSIALLENLALGAPCIVSSAMLSSGLLGSRGAALVTDLSSSLLAECIRQVDAAAPTLSQNARSLVADEFSWASAGKRYFASLRSILGGA